MHIEIPDDLGVTEEPARLDFAVGLYASHSASIAQAARLAGRSRVDFHRIVAERGIPVAYDSGDIEDDMAALRRLGQL